MNKQVWGWKGCQELEEKKHLQQRERVSTANADGRYPSLAASDLKCRVSNAAQFIPRHLRVQVTLQQGTETPDSLGFMQRSAVLPSVITAVIIFITAACSGHCLFTQTLIKGRCSQIKRKQQASKRIQGARELVLLLIPKGLIDPCIPCVISP